MVVEEMTLAEQLVLQTAGVPLHLVTDREAAMALLALDARRNIPEAANEVLRMLGCKEIS